MKKITFILLSFFLMSWSCENKKEQFVGVLMNDSSHELNNLLETYPEEIYSCFGVNGSNYNLLALAIKHNRQECFDMLINRKFDLNHQCSNKNALMYASKYGRLDMVKKLINIGANVNMKNSSQENALDYAIKYNQIEVQKYLESLIK